MVAKSMQQQIIKTDHRTEKGRLSSDFVQTERKDFAKAFMSLNANRRKAK